MSLDCRRLDLEEAAELLGDNYNLICKLVQSGKSPIPHVGRLRRVGFTELDLFPEKSKITCLEWGACASCGLTNLSRHSLREGCSECVVSASVCRNLSEGLKVCHKHRQDN